MNKKASAYKYLKGLHLTLDQQLYGPSKMKKEIDETVAHAKGDSEMKYLNERELAFVNVMAVPLLFRSLASFPGMSEDTAGKPSYVSHIEHCHSIAVRRLRVGCDIHSTRSYLVAHLMSTNVGLVKHLESH